MDVALDQLHQAVDHERSLMEGGSLFFIILGILAMITLWVTPLVNYLRFPSVSPPYDRVTIFLTFIWLGLLYLGFRMNRFASTIGQSLKKDAVTGAKALLDYLDKSYKLRRNFILVYAFGIFVFGAYELVGMYLSWWEWTEFSFATYIFLLIAVFVMVIIFVPFTNKWKIRNKTRRRIETMMEEYRRQQDANINDAPPSPKLSHTPK
jgi:hypothetical protein